MGFGGSMGDILASVSAGQPIRGKLAKSKLNKLNNWVPGQKSVSGKKTKSVKKSK